MYLLLFTLVVAGISGQQPCHDNWEDATSADLGCLFFLEEPMNWDQAEARCKEMDNAHLIEIKSETGLEFLRAELHEREYTWWWTGGTTKTNTFWTWRCSFSGIDPFVWWPGEPNNDYEQNCLYLHNYDVAGGELYGFDENCEAEVFYPICQQRICN